MVRNTFLIFMLLFLASASCFSQNLSQRDRLQKEINKIIYYDAGISYEEVPGFIIGLIFKDTTFVFSYGTAKVGEEKVIQKNDLFEIGGITKVFTSCLSQILIDEGYMHADSSINIYLKPEQRNPAIDISISQILTHTSGLPRLPHGIGIREKDANNPYAFYTHDDLTRFFVNYRTVPSKQEYIYSHLSFALLELAIENVFGKPYEEVLKEKLIDPIKLYDTAINLDQEQKSRVVQGYNLIGKESDPWAYSSFEGSVGLKSSMRDLMQFLKINLGISQNEVLNSLEKLHDPTVNTALDKNTFIASGWHVVKKKNCNVIAHSGSTASHRGFIGFVKESQTGVVVLSNSEFGMNSLGYHILRMLNNNWKKTKKKSS